MWPFPKVHFRWREPPAFRRTLAVVEAGKMRWWFKPLAGLGFAGLLMTNWWLATLDPNKQPPSLGVAAIMALVGGPAVVYFLAWVYPFFPATVMVLENRLARACGSTGAEWKYAGVAAYSFHDCGDYRVLTLDLHSGRQVLVGVPLGVDRGKLEDFLARKLPPTPSHLRPDDATR
jgi:hypothetical protein